MLPNRLITLCFCVTLIVRAQDPELKRRTPENEAARSQHDRRITLDIEVADAAGKPLTGLAQSDFTLLDNGTAKPLTSFQEIDAHVAQPATEAILVFDTMNATFEDAGIMRQGIDAFLRQNGGRLPLPVSIVFLTDTASKLSVSSTDGVELAKDFSKTQTPMRVLGSAQGTGGAMDRERRSVRALQMIAEYEASRPGRKLLLWIGPGWPLLAGARTAELSTDNAHRYYDTVVGLTTQLRRAQITLYSVAPLNLAHGTVQNAFFYQSFLKGVTAPGQADSPNLAVQVLAVHSGGLVLDKTGDIPFQIRRCLADSESFYQVSFDADAGDDLGVYHSIDVTVDRPGSAARTNTAYYAGKPQALITPLRKESIPALIAQQPALRAQTRLIVLDVTVLDHKGLPVTNLRPDDFQLLDDGHPVTVAHLEEHAAALVGPPLPVSPSAPGNMTGATTPVAVGNRRPEGTLWNVVAVDLINTPKEVRGRLQEQLETFARQIPEGTPVALVSMAGDIKVLSSFADGKPGLIDALKRGLGPINVGGPANSIERGEIADEIDFGHAAGRQQKANVDVERQTQRAQVTLNDFASIARWLKGYQGRKNVFWLSSGFPIEGKPFGTAGYEGLKGTSAGQRLPMQDKTDKELETARVAIYPIDVRGVAVADINGETTADSAGSCAFCQAVDADKDSDLKIGQRSEMLEIAHATGGVARFNNDIAKSLVQGFEQAGRYYTISYTPQDTMWDGRYHRFKLVLERPDIQMIYRQGYYAKDPQTDPAPTPEEFKAALAPDTPPAASVRFKVKVLPGANSAEVQYVIDSSTVAFVPTQDGKLLGDVDCAVLEFNGKGKVQEKSLIRLSETVGSSQTVDLHAKQTVPLRPGAATLVVGVRDRVTGLYGKLEVSIPRQ